MEKLHHLCFSHDIIVTTRLKRTRFGHAACMELRELHIKLSGNKKIIDLRILAHKCVVKPIVFQTCVRACGLVRFRAIVLPDTLMSRDAYCRIFMRILHLSVVLT
jgi:hypothetical protein